MQQKTVYQLTGYELGSLTTEITMQTTSTSLQVTVRVKVRGPNGLSYLYFGYYLSVKALTWVSQTAVTSLAANQKSMQYSSLSFVLRDPSINLYFYTQKTNAYGDGLVTFFSVARPLTFRGKANKITCLLFTLWIFIGKYR